MRLSRAWKLLLGYMLVVAVSISTFALLANRSTERELRLMMGQAPEGTALAAERLAAYYRGRGSWEGVESLYPSIAHGSGMGRGMQAAMGGPAGVDSRGLPLPGGLAALLSIGAALVVAALLTTGMLKPVRELTGAARDLAGGDLTRRVQVRTRDEVGELSEAFNHMAHSLEEAETLRGDMTADVAHELRDPLSVMPARVGAVMDGVA